MISRCQGGKPGQVRVREESHMLRFLRFSRAQSGPDRTLNADQNRTANDKFFDKVYLSRLQEQIGLDDQIPSPERSRSAREGSIESVDVHFQDICPGGHHHPGERWFRNGGDLSMSEPC